MGQSITFLPSTRSASGEIEIHEIGPEKKTNQNYEVIHTSFFLYQQILSLPDSFINSFRFGCFDAQQWCPILFPSLFLLSTFADCDTHSITVNVNVIPFWCVRLSLGMVSMCVQNKLAPYLATVSMSGELNCDKTARLRCGKKKAASELPKEKMRAKQNRQKNGRAKWNSIQCSVWFSKMHSDFRSHNIPAMLHVFISFNQNESISTQFLQSSFRHGSLDADHQRSSCFRIVHSLLHIEYIVCVTLLAFFSICCPCIKCRFISFWVIWKWLAQIDTLFNLNHRWCLFIFMSTSLLLSSFPFSSYVSFMVLFHGIGI